MAAAVMLKLPHNCRLIIFQNILLAKRLHSMKTKAVLFSLLVAAVLNQCISSKDSNSERNLFDYFSQVPPKDTAEVFAPGIISDTVKKAWSLAISPNGDEVFFSRGKWPDTRIMYMKKTGDSWSLPDTAGFSRDCRATEPAFSPDGRYLYFSTNKGNMDIYNYSLWRIRKPGDGWSQPEKLFDLRGDSIWEFHPSVTSDGSLYFCNWDHCCPVKNGILAYNKLVINTLQG